MHRQAGRESEYDYFDATHWTDEWTMDGQTARISIWHRPLHAMIEVFTGAGFRITVISEPEPGPAARELFPETIVAKPRFLCFLFFSSSCRRLASGRFHHRVTGVRNYLPRAVSFLTCRAVRRLRD